MNLFRLAELQKRARFWHHYAETEIKDTDLKTRTLRTLSNYQKLITECWESQEISTEAERTFDSLERELQRLNEEARMTNVPTASRR